MGQVCITETSLIDKEWSPDEMNGAWSLDETGVVLNGMKIANKRTTHL